MLNQLQINNIALQEMRKALREGAAVTFMPSGGSMLPTLQGGKVSVTIKAVVDRKLRRGDIVAYLRNGMVVVHRVLHTKGELLTIRGDAGVQKDYVAKSDVLGVVTSVLDTATGNIHKCGRLQGEWAMGRNAVRCFVHRYFHRQIRLALAPWYFLVLALLMWLPSGGVPLDNFVFGIRADHLIHASVYVFCTWFLMDQLWLHRGWQIWLLGVLVGVVTESGQYLLPYRSFDINDMVSNALGVSLGWLPVLCYRRLERGRWRRVTCSFFFVAFVAAACRLSVCPVLWQR